MDVCDVCCSAGCEGHRAEAFSAEVRHPDPHHRFTYTEDSYRHAHRCIPESDTSLEQWEVLAMDIHMDA